MASFNEINLLDVNLKEQTRKLADGSRVTNLPNCENLLVNLEENIKTSYDLFLNSIKISNNGKHFEWKDATNGELKSMSYAEVKTTSERIGSALVYLGVEPDSNQKVCIYAKNRPEWVICDIACNSYSITSVALYDTLGEESISFIVNQTKAKVVFCDDSAKALRLMKEKTPIECIILMDDTIKQSAEERANQLGIQLIVWPILIEIGAIYYRKPVPPKPDSIYTINYTSGTTGLPKGAVITHENVIALMSSIKILLKPVNLINGEERHLSFLPLAHMFERIAQLFILSIGGCSCFFGGDVRKIGEDLKFFKPTFFTVVPRLLNKFYALINHTLKSAPNEKQQMFEMAFKGKEKEIANGGIGKLSNLDKAFVQIKETFGGSVKVMVIGSAPISAEILHFFKTTTGAFIIQGYGATETCGVSTTQLANDASSDNVGTPLLCNKVKLVDVPEMDLVAERDNKGEIVVKGKNVFKGYFMDEEKTKAVLDSDGWYHTGDIGSFDDSGRLKIVDRVKHIFKLSQGEYIAPEKIENVYSKCPLIGQIFVYGNSLKSSLVAIVVPEEAAIAAWCQKNNVPFNFKAMCKSPKLKAMLMQMMAGLGKEANLNSLEQVKDVYIHDELFSVENSLLTATMKSKRYELAKYFKAQIDQMYTNLE